MQYRAAVYTVYRNRRRGACEKDGSAPYSKWLSSAPLPRNIHERPDRLIGPWRSSSRQMMQAAWRLSRGQGVAPPRTTNRPTPTTITTTTTTKKKDRLRTRSLHDQVRVSSPYLCHVLFPKTFLFCGRLRQDRLLPIFAFVSGFIRSWRLKLERNARAVWLKLYETKRTKQKYEVDLPRGAEGFNRGLARACLKSMRGYFHTKLTITLSQGRLRFLFLFLKENRIVKNMVHFRDTLKVPLFTLSKD